MIRGIRTIRRIPTGPMGTDAPGARELGEGYYLENLEHVVTHALERYGGVLDDAEARVLGRFLELSLDARRLYARLWLRRGPIFRRSQVAYREIACLDDAARELELGGLLARREIPDDPDDALELVALFTTSELKSAARSAGMRVSGRKDDLVASIAASPGARAVLATSDSFLERLLGEVFDLARLLFFGNLGQDLSEFVLVSLERTRYPEYELARDVPLFASRAALTSFLAAAAFDAEELDESDGAALAGRARIAIAELAAARATPPHAWRLDPRRYFARAAFAAARQCERLGDAATAMDVYCALVRLAPQAGVRAEAADRLGLVAARTGSPERFLATCEGLATDTTLDAIARFAVESRLATVCRHPSPRRRLTSPPVVELTLQGMGHAGGKALYASVSGEPVTIEEAVLEALGGGLHAENTLYRSLFGLLLWDVIFSRVPGMFQHRFQAAPLDLASEHFYENRRERFEARFAELERSDLAVEARRSWERYAGLTNAFVAWDAYGPDELEHAAAAFGRRLLPVLERLARSPRRHGRGLPDLLVFEAGEPVLVEVKGPGDQPQLEQRLWHDMLLRVGLDVRIARVRRQLPRTE